MLEVRLYDQSGYFFISKVCGSLSSQKTGLWIVITVHKKVPFRKYHVTWHFCNLTVTVNKNIIHIS